METYHEMYDALMIRAVSIVHSSDIARDIMQDIAVMLLEKGGKLQNIQYKEAFLNTCVRNRAIDILRKNVHATAVDPQTMARLRSGVQSTDFLRVENEQWLKACLSTFPTQLREAFAQHVLNGYPIHALAKAMGIPSNTLAQQFRRMKRKIKHFR